MYSIDKTFLESVFRNMPDDELMTALTTKASDYSTEALQVALKEAKGRNLQLPDEKWYDILMYDGKDDGPETKEWYYALDGKRRGPVSTNRLRNLYRNQYIFEDTNVWKSGMKDWIRLSQTDVLDRQDVPPPLTGRDTGNTLAWILAFVPVISAIILYLIAGVAGIRSVYSWIVPILLNSVLCVWDVQYLKKAGHNTKELLLWGFILIPVYLFRRAFLLKQGKGYAVIWCVVFVLSMFLS